MSTTHHPSDGRTLVRTLVSGAYLALLATPAIFGQSQTGLPEAWRAWRYSAPIGIPAGQNGLTAVQISPAVSADSQGTWDGLRVVDGESREVPFVVYARTERSSVEQRTSRLLEVTFAPGSSTQGIVDLGEDPAEHNAIEISVGERDYFLWVELAVSTNNRAWRLLNERSPIYRFLSNSLDGNQTVRYSPSRSRYLRVRLLDGTRKLPLDGVRVTRVVRREAERARIGVALAPDSASPANESWWVADLAESRRPVSELRVESGLTEFHRAVRIQVSDDGQRWRTAGQGDIFRVPRRGPGVADVEDEGTRERLRVSFPETRARYWRVEVVNRNDPPIAGLAISLFGTPRRVVFRAEPGRSYRLLFGNARAAAAQYEMARLTPETDLESAKEATLGGVAVNSNWVDPAPWSERNPFVLWAAVIAAAVILGVLALQALGGSAASSRKTDGPS